MNILKASFEIIDQQYNEDLKTNMLKHIELCGRTCYKSEDKITDASYEKFVKMLIESEHGAMLEHGTVYLKISIPKKAWFKSVVDKYYGNPHSKVNNTFDDYDYHYFITTNYRVLIENGWLDDLKYMCAPTEYHEKRYTVKFTYHLAVARDINRHRVQSVGEESTRYCNYSKEKFGGELNYIEPVFLSDEEKLYLNNKNEQMSFAAMCNQIGNDTYNSSFASIDYFIFALEACEFSYLNLIKLGWKPQQASLVLPLDTKTESVHTGFTSDWIHFFNLRALGTTGAPRPSAKEVAWPLMEEFFNREYISRNDVNEVKYNYIIEKYPNIEDYIKL